jgi:bifunctional DNA primase/polymerase-like protein/primase-like protein
MPGIFTQFQPRYAEHWIATFPVSETKRPLINGWPKVGLRGSSELARKFDGADAFGYLTGRRSRITVVDIDTTEEKVAEDAISRHGQPGIITRTASGKSHLLYRYNGERRRIRPWPGLPIDLLGDGGFAIGAPSRLAKGSYEIVHGHLDDLDRLAPMVGIDIEATETPIVLEEKSEARSTIPHGRRNNTLWRYCMKQAHLCGGRMELVDMARAYNDHHCTPPLSQEEVLTAASSAWSYTERGENRFGQHGCYFRTDEIVSMLHDDQDALILLAFLKAHNGPWATFMCTNDGLTEELGWDRHRLADARHRLIELGYMTQIRKATQGHPALFQWAD